MFVVLGLLACFVSLWCLFVGLVWVFVANCRCCRVFGLRGVGLLLFDLFVVYFDLTLVALPVVFICLLVGVGSWFAQIVCVWFVVCVWLVACGLLLGLDVI